MVKPVSFLEYGRITDTIMWFDSKVRLNIIVNLTYNNKYKDKTGSNLSEYMYYNENLGQNMISVKRTIDCSFCIDSSDKEIFLPIGARDLYIMQKALTDMVLPWFFGEKPMFKMDNNGRLLLKGRYTPVEIPFNNNYFIRFDPIVIDYADGSCKDGVRITINDNNTFVDCNVNKLLEFYYYIMNTDLVCAAQNMINYIKTPPYGEGLVNINAKEGANKSNVGNFFNQ